MPSPIPFSHQWLNNGLMLSTCLLCSKVAASPDPKNLKVAEQCHHCDRRPSKALKREADYNPDRKAS
jgi:hypothetical protein